jgi:hypothetical protein
MVAYRWFILPVMVLFWLCIGACVHVGDSGTSVEKVRSSVHEDGQPRVLIVYQSKYGSTKQYAEWLHRDIPSDLINAEKEDRPEFSRYDVIVFGSYIRMGRIVIVPLIVENWGNVKGKKIILFTASGTPPGHPNIRKIYDSGLPENIRREIKYFPLRGRILSKDLSFFDTLLVAVGRMGEKDESLRKVMGEDFDDVKLENLIPLSEYIKTLMREK